MADGSESCHRCNLTHVLIPEQKETWFDADLAERINTLKTLRDAVLVLVESARNEK